MEGIKSAVLSGSDDLYVRYEACVAELSAISPLLAYRLSGRELLKTLLQQVDATLADFDAHTSPGVGEDIRRLTAFSKKESKKGVFEEIAKDLRQDIRAVSWKAGLVQYVQILYQHRPSGILGGSRPALRDDSVDGLLEPYFLKVRNEYEKAKVGRKE
jgi:hypothetical protein